MKKGSIYKALEMPRTWLAYRIVRFYLRCIGNLMTWPLYLSSRGASLSYSMPLAAVR